MSTTQTTEKTKKKTTPPPKAPKETTTVATRTSNLPAGATDATAWGAPTITARDIVIPKILAMQAMSNDVTSGEAKFGEFRESLNKTVLGDITHPIEFIPFYSEKVFVVMVEEKGAFKFKAQIAITNENEDHEFEIENEEGNTEKWYRTLQFYILLPKEVENGAAIPYLLAFRSSSARAGQKLMTTMFMKNLKAGKTPASMVMKLSGAKTTNDKGTFIVMDVIESRPSTDAEVGEAFEWVKTIRAGAVKVDHSDLATETTQAPTVEPESGEY